MSSMPVIFVNSRMRDTMNVMSMVERLWVKYGVPFVNTGWRASHNGGGKGWFARNTTRDRYVRHKDYVALENVFSRLRMLQDELGLVTVAFEGRVRRVI